MKAKPTWMRRLTVRCGAGLIPGAADREWAGGGLPLSLRKVSIAAADLANSKADSNQSSLTTVTDKIHVQGNGHLIECEGL